MDVRRRLQRLEDESFEEREVAPVVGEEREAVLPGAHADQEVEVTDLLLCGTEASAFLPQTDGRSRRRYRVP